MVYGPNAMVASIRLVGFHTVPIDDGATGSEFDRIFEGFNDAPKPGFAVRLKSPCLDSVYIYIYECYYKRVLRTSGMRIANKDVSGAKTSLVRGSICSSFVRPTSLNKVAGSQKGYWYFFSTPYNVRLIEIEGYHPLPFPHRGRWALLIRVHAVIWYNPRISYGPCSRI